MAAYLIAIVNVTDPDRYAEYKKLSPGAIAAYGGKFIARGGPVVSLEGPEPAGRVVVVEFPSLEQAEKCYRSPEYAAAKAKREGAAEAQFFVVDGG